MEQDKCGLPDIEQFAGLQGNSCRYGLFNRHGGVSKGAFDSLNIGLAVGDAPELVAENRRLVKARMGVSHLLSGKQVHGEEVYSLAEPLTEDLEVDGYDAFITNQPDVGLMVQHADCQALLLYDPENKVIGAVHSGWRGSVMNIIGTTVQAMQKEFGCNPGGMRAVVSPSLGPCCAEFVHYQKELPAHFQQHMDDRLRFDFWQISRDQLLEQGLADSAIILPGRCTSCSEDYFSYRRACRESNGITGRNCSVIAL
ncbi:peptidoglycan editing factor PgeF [Desulfosediminicola ganghwensis]|uniref:peptidoglycan editing factor PgeF n=1 Tax=Desulfosediminicola ganghwensis TaxID=2569540 RepID=UPI0010ABFD79|nr:peptidoglycan editing factor PgeF [Desulfosediminicola ganghwensis]